MLLRCYLIHTAIIISKHILYLVHLCPCLGLGLFNSNPYDLFSFSALLSLFSHFFEWQRRWRKPIISKKQKFSLGLLLGFCLPFGQFQPGFACKSVAYKKACSWFNYYYYNYLGSKFLGASKLGDEKLIH